MAEQYYDQFRVRIEVAGAAFDPDPAPEIARILEVLAQTIRGGAKPDLTNPLFLQDINGNQAGTAALSS